ncbi:MAG TPA: YhcN/YlaJ family sporulation lipoprotein [Tissierellales bacterium]|nr:YhcN/YlaJ family sporulation lipoprotein [Tissierellales bacterium]
MKKNNKFILILGLLLISITLFGCQPKTPQKPDTQTQDRLENRVAEDRRNENRAPTTPNNIDNNNNNNNGIVDDTDLDLNNRDGRNDGNDDLTDNNDITNMKDRHNRIVKKCTDLKDIEDAAVVISGKTALVGIDLDEDVEGEMTNELKRKVVKIVKDTDRNIENVGVSADPDIWKRIVSMADDIEDGKPLSGFANEIEEIFRRIAPSK